MTPITEDQVVALMDGFAAREKDVIKTRHTEIASGDAAEEQTTASILRFARKAEVVALNAHRKTTGPRRTVSGMFYYIGGRTGAPA